MTEPLSQTPLHKSHLEAGAKMVPFAGYDMPVQYGSVIAEARAVRDGAGMFDVSHMARLTFEGADAQAFLEQVTTNDVSRLEDMSGQYSLLPNDKGGLVDDIIVYRIGDHPTGPWAPSPERGETMFKMVVNAANHAKDVAWLQAHIQGDVRISDQTDATAMIAVQGPKATEILARLCNRPEQLRSAKAFGVVVCNVVGAECFCARSGYTGEDGFELICEASAAETVWNALAGAGVAPCGLAARDTLRVEAGLPLYGHELNDDLSPIAAGLGWVIGKTKTFIGSEPIRKAKEQGTPRKLQGVRLHTKRLLTPGMKVYSERSEIGEITSGVVSPLLDAGIAFAFIDASIAPGAACEVDVRGKMEPATIVGKRFFKREKS